VAYLEQERGHSLIFEIDERAGEVVILALRHSRRRPGGWRRRWGSASTYSAPRAWES